MWCRNATLKRFKVERTPKASKQRKKEKLEKEKKTIIYIYIYTHARVQLHTPFDTI